MTGRPRFPLLAELTAADGTRLVLRCLRAPGERGERAPVLVLLPAMGTPARQYAPFVRALNQRELTVVTVDPRGHGESTPRAARAVPCGYREVVEQDIGAVLEAVRDRLPHAERTYLVGHSLGGQLGLIHAALYAPELAGAVLVAAGSAWHRCFPLRARLRWLGVGAAGSPLARLLGHWPGATLGIGDREGARLMRDWARQARTGRYRAEGSRHDYERALAGLELPVLAVDVEDDALAPPAAVDHLCGKLPSRSVTRWHYPRSAARGKPLGHFRWVRHNAALVERIAAWTGAEEPEPPTPPRTRETAR
ncbi:MULTISPECIES: alpha/beta fold hydrolase [unclassified Streptomyces]|uniref:alpha/beta hydrolase family protein n=1 Tax=unclassified Streptomyces TaxID=2593676 RepID=UPI00278C3DB9|nr:MULTISPECIES: alpha/beta fold hydrolase [unclassified Streptomyces]